MWTETYTTDDNGLTYDYEINTNLLMDLILKSYFTQIWSNGVSLSIVTL